jgi:hypothetical protein
VDQTADANSSAFLKAGITLTLWKKGEDVDAKKLKSQAA